MNEIQEVVVTSIGEGRIFSSVDRVGPAVVERARAVATANLADAMHGFGVVHGIGMVGDGVRRVVGPAVTVDITPGDGLYARIALSLCEPGDVLVINAHGCSERAVLGGSICIAAHRRGLAGIVVDGAVRDIGEIEDVGLSVMSRWISPRSGTTDSGWGEVNVPVALGGVVVMPGDLIVGDREGCVVVPRGGADDLMARAASVEEEKGKPEDIGARIEAAGDWISGLDKAQSALLRRGGRIDEARYQS